MRPIERKKTRIRLPTGSGSSKHGWTRSSTRNLDKVLAFCWAKLGEAPPKQAADAPTNEDDDRAILREKLQQAALDGLMRQRAFATVMNLAARKNADPKAVQRLMKYVDAGIAQGGDTAAAWRQSKFELLVMLDRPDDLNANCASGFDPKYRRPRGGNRWRSSSRTRQA